MKIKNVLYWCSIVMPLTDVLCGVLKAISEIPDDVRKIHANRKFIEENYRFLYEQSQEDMTEDDFYDKYYGKNLKKGKKKNG